MPGSGRRLLMLLLVLGVIGAPAMALRAACVGAACDATEPTARAVPFCSLPEGTRTLLTAGFYGDRSPDALGVTTADTLLRSGSGKGEAWPALGQGEGDLMVPLAIAGDAVAGDQIPYRSLADIAPTLEPLLGIERPNPEVRSGRQVPGVIRAGAHSRLVVAIVWKRADLGAAPLVEDVFADRDDVAFGEARIGSLPLDPAAIMTTIGSGGLPAEHGIIGAVLRDKNGALVPAWSATAPTSVISTLGDDLDELTANDAKIGIVAEDATDRGLIGGTWYHDRGERDEDDVLLARRDPMGAVEGLLDHGYGEGGAADLLGVTLGSEPSEAAAQTRAIVELVFETVPDATIVLTTTGAGPEGETTVTAEAFASAIETNVGAPVVGRVATGGVFLDQDVVTERRIATQRVVEAMTAVRTPSGVPLLADAFPTFAVEFGRYC